MADLEYEIDFSKPEAVAGLSSLLEGAETLCTGAVVELMLSCSRDLKGPSVELRDLAVCEPIKVREARAWSIVTFEGPQRIELCSRPSSSPEQQPIRIHAFACIAEPAGPTVDGVPVFPDRSSAVRADADLLCARLSVIGATPGDHLRILGPIDFSETRAQAQVVRAAVGETESSAFAIDPIVADALLQLVLFANSWAQPAANRIVSVGRLRAAPGGRPALICAERCATGTGGWNAWVLDEEGACIAQFADVRTGTAVDQRSICDAYLEREVAEIVRSTLQLPELRATDDFVAAGASSFDLIRLRATLIARFKQTPAIEDLLSTPTIRALVQVITTVGTGQFEADAYSISNARSDHRFLTRAERRLWFLERFGNVGAAYNEMVAWRVRGRLRLDLLRRCLDVMAQRHHNLTCTFPLEDGIPVRRLDARARARVDVVAVSDATSAHVSGLIADIAARRFEIAEEALFRVVVLQLAEDDCVLMLVAHHLASDAWSSAHVLHPELSALFNAYSRGESLELEPPTQIAQYAAWEAQSLSPARLEYLVKWWTEELRGAPTAFELPADKQRPHRLGHRGARFRGELSQSVSRGILELARSLSTTPFVVLLAAYRVLLFRYSAQADALIGVPMSLRRGPAMDSIVGCLVNTVPLRLMLSPEQSLNSVIRQAKRRVIGAIGHGDLPFDELVTAMRCERATSHTPLVQVGFNYLDDVSEDLELVGLEVHRIPITALATKFEVMLEVHRSAGGMRFEFEYSTDLFRPERFEAMARHLQLVLAQMTLNGDVSIAGDWFIDATDRAQLASFGSGAPALFDHDLWRPVEAQCERCAAHVALHDQTGVVHYAELRQQVERLSARLRATLSDPKSQPVAILADTSTDWVIAVLAVARLGWSYLPIDPRTPDTRVQSILTSSQAALLLYADESVSTRAFEGPKLAILASDDVRPDVQPARTPPAPDCPVYAITTSGSTGVPKAASVPYRGVANLVAWYAQTMHIDPSAKLLVATSVAFDLTQKNVFAALASGASIVLHRNDPFDPRALSACIEQHAITHVNCTPTLWYAILDACSDHGYRPLRSLRTVVLGGEPIDAAKLADWRRSYGRDTSVWNSYGPTECSDVAVAYRLDAQENDALIPIGKPLPNVELRVLDDRGLPVPIGALGELYIAGAGLGHAYHGDPAATARAFVQIAPGTTAYRTGDFVRYDWDGNLLFAGRADRQLKIRGHRVELEEIESVLARHPDVREVAVDAPLARDGLPALEAYYVSTSELNEGDLRVWLAARLPRYMLPRRAFRVATIPRTATGKLDRRALAALSRQVPSSFAREPGSKLERELLALWRSILEVPELDVEQDFFAAGGHSLLAVRAADEIERALGCRCSVIDLVDNPVVRELALVLAQRLRRAG